MIQSNLELTRLLKKIQKSPNNSLKDYTERCSEAERMALREEFKSLALYLDFKNVLTDTGVITEHSFLKEFFYRLNRHIFPPLYMDKEFRNFLANLNQKTNFSETISTLELSELTDFFDWLLSEDTAFAKRMRIKLKNPLKILASRLVYHGNHRQIQLRLQQETLLSDSFIETADLIYLFLEDSSAENYNAVHESLAVCKKACNYIRDKKATDGISLEVTYEIIIIIDILERIDDLARLRCDLPGKKNSAQASYLIKKIVQEEKDSRKVSSIFYEYIELVFYEITEHTGKVGENYISTDRAGYYKMLRKGFIGGLIVGFLALLKPAFGELYMAPILEGFGYSLIYSAIFLLIYFMHGVLATKQPAMTASKISQQIDEHKNTISDIWHLSELIRNTFRTQIVAIFGNFAIALPIAGSLYFLLGYFGVYQLSEFKAKYLINSLHPVYSLSLFYAAITGVCLAISGIMAGAVRNWFVFNHIKERTIASLKRSTNLGQQQAINLVNWLEKHMDGLSGNISLGFMLGYLSVAGKILGLPIDIRHITFASAQAGTGLAHSLYDLSYMTIVWLSISVLLIGLINLSVSFGITFLIVFKSRKLKFAQGRSLIIMCLKRFLKKPSSYLLPD